MSIQGDEPGRQVRFGATVAAVGRALRISGPAVLIAWAAHTALSSITPVLRANHLTVLHLPVGTLSLPVTAGLAVVSGLLIRWSLLRTPAALRPDARLAGYVGLIVLSVMITSLVSYAILSGVSGAKGAALGYRYALIGLANLVITLIYALLALWPLGVLMGDRLSPSALISRMRQAYFTFLGLTLLLAVPAAALTYMRLFARRVLPNLTDNLLYAALAALTATLSALVLAQIYARRVRGCDLGATQQESVADVFA